MVKMCWAWWACIVSCISSNKVYNDFTTILYIPDPWSFPLEDIAYTFSHYLSMLNWHILYEHVAPSISNLSSKLISFSSTILVRYKYICSSILNLEREIHVIFFFYHHYRSGKHQQFWELRSYINKCWH